MVTFENLKLFLSYIIEDVMCGIFYGLIDGCWGLIFLIQNLCRVFFNKNIRSAVFKTRTSRLQGAENSNSQGTGNSNLQRTRSSNLQRRRNSRDPSKKYPECVLALEVAHCIKFNGFVLILTYLIYLVCSYSTSFRPTSPFIEIILHTFWNLPVYITVKLTNVFWIQDIITSAYQTIHGNPAPTSISDFAKSISDIICSVVIEIMFFMQGSMMMYVPYPKVSFILYVIHIALSNSLYAFEYMWSNKGWSLHQRIRYVESNWPYFTGFGMPLAFVTYYLSSIYSVFVYSMVFPIYAISAFSAPSREIRNRGLKFKLFSPVIWFSSQVSKSLFMIKKLGSR